MLPRLLHIYGPLWVRSYGLMIALGFLLFLYFSYNHRLRKKLIPGDLYLNLVFLGLVSGIIGGRLLFVIFEWNRAFDHWYEMFYPWVGGFVVLGSMIGVLATVPAYLWYKRIQVLPTLDFISIYIPLLESIARIGCLFAGCCYGMRAAGSLPWAVTFTHSEGSAPLGIPLHPTQLYLSLGSLGIFLLLRFWLLPLVKKPGTLLFSYLILTSILRFGVDFWRGDRGNLVDFAFGSWVTLQLSHVQLYVLCFFMVSLAGLLVSMCIQKKSHLYQ